MNDALEELKKDETFGKWLVLDDHRALASDAFEKMAKDTGLFRKVRHL